LNPANQSGFPFSYRGLIQSCWHLAAMIRAVRSIVHDGNKPKDALEMYNDLSK